MPLQEIQSNSKTKLELSKLTTTAYNVEKYTWLSVDCGLTCIKTIEVHFDAILSKIQ